MPELRQADRCGANGGSSDVAPLHGVQIGFSVSDSWGHLASRFFGSLGSGRPLSAAQIDTVNRYLHADVERALFWDQPVLDQHHGLQSLQRLLESHPSRADLQRAALLHDVGKRHAQLGVVGRVAAWSVRKLGLPVTGRFRTFHDHGVLGSAELGRAKCETIVVEFARLHHGKRPDTIAASDWFALLEADR